ncbi:hypothetical protein F7725_002555 [Dissostichus mawsoni]|uniref:G-protein coupled receptors family 1 profile domain-containing protein n=1 Tax=Dissostichus mawsoni TaxID=36200 RepID=A0A7J5Y2P6_DISMA|nr:hypothetical protein F7725_002555 [Dissostichus mawsoni]
MKSNSSLNPPYFQFTLFADFGPLRYLFFILCLFIYVTIVSANMVIILAVFLEKSLHQPMYIFISCLCLNSLCGSAGFFPRFLQDILSDSHLISRPLCFIQMYVIYTYASCELSILTIMAYDRFIAICQPLHYHSKMTFKWVQCYDGFCLYLTVKLPLCGNKLNRIFCSNWPVVQLSCVDTTPNKVTGYFLTVTIFIPILRPVHISTDSAGLQEEIYLIIPPLNNPIVYGLGLPQIKGVVLRFLKKDMKSNSSLNPPYFQFTLFADFGPLRYLFFILCLFIYVTIVSANMVIILAVFLEKSLHQPMYIFISCLCLNSLWLSWILPQVPAGHPL